MRFIKTLPTVAALLFAGGTMAQTVRIEDAWARATVPGQQATGAFMTLTAPAGARLIGVNSPAAGVSEIHEMVMQDDVMKMRAIAALELPAGQPVQLKPGGYHLMLMDLKAPLTEGSAVPLTLVLRDAQGAEVRQDLRAQVRAVTLAPAHHHPR
jgi:copper(I)-binding protein